MEETAVVRIRLDTGNLPAASQKAGQALAGIGKAGEMSARQTAQAMRQLPAQFTDVATSLAGGQNPLLVLLQQGGQVKDSFGGIGPALSGVGAALNPMIIGVGAGAAAVAALTAASSQASDEHYNLTRAVTLTGTAAGLTVPTLRQMARTLDEAAGITQGRATKALITVAEASGAVTKDLGQLTAAALHLERAGGPAVEETAKAFEKLRRDPLAATRELGTQLGYLTPALYDQVRVLTEQGRTLDAASVAQRAYAAAAQQAAGQLEQALTPLQKGWRSLKETVAEAWDFMVGASRAPTVLERLDQVNAQLTRAGQARRRGTAGSQGLAELGREELTGERAALNRAALNNVEFGEARRAAIELAQQYGVARESADKWATSGVSAAEKMAAALKKLREDVTLIRGAGGSFTDKQLRAAEEGIRREFLGNAEKRPEPKVDFDVLDRWDARVKAINAALRDDPLGAFIDDQLNALKKRDERAGEQADQQQTRLLAQNQAYLAQLAEDNARFAAEQITDERERGEALIRLDAQTARRRLDARALAGEIGGPQLAEGRTLLNAREQAQLTAQAESLSRRMGQSLYDDTKSALASALRDTKDPVKAFVQAFGNMLYARLVDRMADAMATAAVGKDGRGGLLQQFLGAMGAFSGGGSSGYTSVDAVPSGVPLATGTNYVPQDNMLALLHKGEAVVPARYNPAAGGAAKGEDNQASTRLPSIVIQGDVAANTMRRLQTMLAGYEARRQQRERF